MPIRKAVAFCLDLFHDAGALAKGLPTVEKLWKSAQKGNASQKAARAKDDDVAP